MYKISYCEYVASKFLSEECGIKNPRFTTSILEMENGAKVGLLHIHGILENGQSKVLDLWPARCQTVEDLEKLPLELKDCQIGFTFFKDQTTGGEIVSWYPKFIGYYNNDGCLVKFSGKWRSWSYRLNHAIWTNEPLDQIGLDDWTMYAVL